MTTGDQRHPIGSEERPLRVAIVGAGPAGFYAADALLRRKLKVQVDLIDRLPTPFGLVRSGVAPDHQKIKAVTKMYEKTVNRPEVRFYGHVKLGQDISVEDLHRFYDQVVYAVGCESDRALGLPGEELAGCYSATEFVGWYNAHPDFRARQFDLSQKCAVVIGIGNVALDVARILGRDPDELARTDIARHALEADGGARDRTLRNSQVREIYLLGRRGPVQAAFTPPEIKELAKLETTALIVEPAELVLDSHSEDVLKGGHAGAAQKILDVLNESARRAKEDEGKEKKIRLRFLVSPRRIIGQNGHVSAIEIERNELYKDKLGRIKARGTGQIETIPAGLVFYAVGYRGIPIPGVPFDHDNGIIANEEGRVVDVDSRRPVADEYVVGWAKRGPTGQIGTNKLDAMATVERMMEDLGDRQAPLEETKEPAAAEAFFRSKQPHLVDYSDWMLLDEMERQRGGATNKVREKFATIEDMLAAIADAKMGHSGMPPIRTPQ